MRVVRLNWFSLFWQPCRSASSCLLFICGLSVLTAQAAAPLADYQQRVARAAQLSEEIAAQAPPSDEQIKRLQVLKQWLPPQEDIEAAPDQTIRVDNRWLHELLDALLAGTGDRLGQLAELHTRLEALDQQLTPATNTAKIETARAKLDRILAQSEYQRSQAQPSAIKQWVDKVLRGLRDLMRRLFGASSPAPIQPSQGTLGFARVLLILVLGLVLLFVLYKFFVWLGGRRRTPAAEKVPRQILGEEISEYTTTEDLLASARMLAQQGDYRTAIRRAYIALLYELEQQGKLRLHQAKTNRDYQDALRHEQAIYSSFVALTRIFERSWYGQGDATQFDFEGFLSGYRETLNE